MIKLSVALPVFNSKKIAWLAMESLCRQQDVDFEWELVIIEENDGNEFGMLNFHSYLSRLEEVGCVSLTYVPLTKWMPLGQKWKEIGIRCDENSEAFILQAADCYSEPKRLRTTYDLIVRGDKDWIQNKRGLFVELGTREHILYQDIEVQQKCGLNMATRTEYIKALPDNDRRAVVDGWLYKNIKPKNPHSITDTDDWKYGVDTHGLNNISKKRHKFFRNVVFPFVPTKLKMDDFMPKDIVERLYSLV